MTTVELIEAFSDAYDKTAGGIRLGEENGCPVIFNVKILGDISQNGRIYTTEAKTRALPMYEGIKVNIDHPDNPHKSRHLRDRFGKIKNPRMVGSGMYGDLIFNPHHELAESIKWLAENMPDCLGLSHNAVGQGNEENGVFHVGNIVKVRSVDIVSDPATTISLAEAKDPTMEKIVEEKKVEVITTEAVTAVVDPQDDFDRRLGFLIRTTKQDESLDQNERWKRLEPELRKALRLEAPMQDKTTITEAVEALKASTDPNVKVLLEHIQVAAPTPPQVTPPPKPSASKPAPSTRQLLESTLAEKQKANAAAAQKIRQHEMAEKKRVNILEAKKIIAELKFPAVALTPHFKTKLANAKDTKQIRELLEDRMFIIAAPSTPAPKPKVDAKDVKVEDVSRLLRMRSGFGAPAF